MLDFSSFYCSGNLNTYVISYLRDKNPSVTYSDWVYISQAKVLTGGIASPLGGEFARICGLRWSLFVGVTFYG